MLPKMKDPNMCVGVSVNDEHMSLTDMCLLHKPNCMQIVVLIYTPLPVSGFCSP